MAGSNRNLKKDEILFSVGDAADGMYLVRKGELMVFLEKDGNNVELARLGPGGMIGEMAFFDKKPRSASVKASQPAELTQITAQDFENLMKQIPKWFIAIMSSLSARLRDTNLRLQKLENQNAGAKAPLEDLKRTLNVLHLLVKNATKEGKAWILPFKETSQEIARVLSMDAEETAKVFAVLKGAGLVGAMVDTYKVEQMTFAAKNTVSEFSGFLDRYMEHFKSFEPFTPAAIEILQEMVKATHSSAYEDATFSLAQLSSDAEKRGINTDEWQKNLAVFKFPSEAYKLVKGADGIGFKVEKDKIEAEAKRHSILRAIFDAGLK